MIRSFIEQERLSVRVTRSVSNDDLLDMIEDALGDRAAEAEEPEEPTEAGDADSTEEAPRRRR